MVEFDTHRLSWGALALFGLVASARAAVRLSESGSSLGSWGLLLGGLLVVASALLQLFGPFDRERDGTTRLTRALTIGGSLLYVAVTLVQAV